MILRSCIAIVFVCLIFSCQTETQAQKEQAGGIAVKTSVPVMSNAVAHLKAPMEESNYPFDITLKRADGSETNSKNVFNFEDGPTIVTFWLTTCYPCRLEMAAIKKKYSRWQEEANFKMVAISTDFEKNYPAFVKMVNENQWPWEVYNDVNRKFWKVMPGGLNGLPQVFVFDKNGEIVYHKRKYAAGDEDILFNKVKELQ